MSCSRCNPETSVEYSPKDICAMARRHYNDLCNDLFNMSYYSRGAINAYTIEELTSGAQELMRKTCANTPYYEDTRAISKK